MTVNSSNIFFVVNIILLFCFNLNIVQLYSIFMFYWLYTSNMQFVNDMCYLKLSNKNDSDSDWWKRSKKIVNMQHNRNFPHIHEPIVNFFFFHSHFLNDAMNRKNRIICVVLSSSLYISFFTIKKFIVWKTDNTLIQSKINKIFFSVKLLLFFRNEKKFEAEKILSCLVHHTMQSKKNKNIMELNIFGFFSVQFFV